MSTSATSLQKLVVISGLSGAGKSVALRTFEDLGYYCVDNLPAELLPAFLSTFDSEDLTRTTSLAVGIDARSRYGQSRNLAQSLQELRTGDLDMRVVFFDCSEQVLLQRFADTRRRHPLSNSGLPLLDAIREEARMLAPVREIADMVLDTSHHNVHRLRRDLLSHFSSNEVGNVTLLFESFAYRHGIPGEADFVFDARGLSNPHWDPELRAMTGRDPRVIEYLNAQDEVQRFTQQVRDLLDSWLPRLARDSTRSYITVAFGCSGGKHRSVYLAEHFAAWARDRDWPDVAVNHREIE